MDIDQEEMRLLVETARRGDPSAFQTLVEAFERPLYTLALQKVGHPEDAQDVVQDAFLEAFRTLERLETPEAFGGWIRKITLNLSYQRLRRRVQRPEQLVGAGTDSALEEVAVSPAGWPDVDPAELPGLVLRSISRVAEAYQLPLMLRYLEKLAPQEIAQELGMKPGTVRVVLHRASKLLRGHLEQVLRERERDR